MKTPSVDDLVLLAEAAGRTIEQVVDSGGGKPWVLTCYDGHGCDGWFPHEDRDQLAEVEAALTERQADAYVVEMIKACDGLSLWMALTVPPATRFACLVEVLR